MPLFNQISIIGVGLIGGSLAKTIRKNQLCNKIVGFFRNTERLNTAIKENIVDQGFLDLKYVVSNSDLIILALPVTQIIDSLSKIKNFVKNDAVIIDVGSTKYEITQKASKLGLNFVGTHPLAGSEKRGLDFSSESLFDSSKVIITPTDNTNKEALKKITLFWEKLNSKIIILSPKEHDKILSFTSHLPHLVSFSLINSIPKKYFPFGASGLKDTTRIALSDAEIWCDIFLSNKKELIKSLNSFQDQIKKIKNCISKNDSKKLSTMLQNSKNKRENIK